MPVAALLVALASVVCFAFVIVRSRILSIVRQVPNVAAGGVTAILDTSLSDEAKERLVQQAGLQLLRLSWQVAWRIAFALFAVFLPLFIAEFLGLVSFEASFGMLMDLRFILAVSVAGVAIHWIWSKRNRSEKAVSDATEARQNAYAPTERIIHALAFSGPTFQKGLARMDDRFHRTSIARVVDSPPIFITSLARGGTTALLRALHDLPEIATHRYSDMPFLSAPLTWSKLSARRAYTVMRERSHGDGIKIGLQSPEAFDEVFWMLHWPEKYKQSHIDLWHASDFDEDAKQFFSRHFNKIKMLRHPRMLHRSDRADHQVRYLSKNNANIARLDLLPRLFPTCQIVVPLREPSAHAASLHRQHQNFGKLHSVDSFNERYMRDIGHFEFGNLHRPLAFDTEILRDLEPEQPDYWLAYWISCFTYVLQDADGLYFITQDRLRAQPDEAMRDLLEHLNMQAPVERRWREVFLNEPDAKMDDLFDPALLERARAVYRRLAALH